MKYIKATSLTALAIAASVWVFAISCSKSGGKVEVEIED